MIHDPDTTAGQDVRAATEALEDAAAKIERALVHRGHDASTPVLAFYRRQLLDARRLLAEAGASELLGMKA